VSLLPRNVLVYAAFGALIGVLYVLTLGGGPAFLPTGVISGAAISASIACFETLAGGGWVARLQALPFGLFLLARAVAWTLFILVGLGLGRLALPPEGRGLLSLGGLHDAVFSFGASLVVLAVVDVSRVLGRGVLLALILGRYYRPQAENRIFVLLDLVGSSRFAEEQGDAAYLGLFNRVLREVTPIIRRHRGEIHRYVGDSVFVTWNARRGTARAATAALACAVEAVTAVGRRGFGAELRAAVHGGPVIAAEIGTEKREIAFIGDTMNTLARIEQVAREVKRNVVASEEVLSLATLPAGMHAEKLGPFTLRGKSERVPLFAVERAAV
jgi:adenylate cyclase